MGSGAGGSEKEWGVKANSSISSLSTWVNGRITEDNQVFGGEDGLLFWTCWVWDAYEMGIWCLGAGSWFAVEKRDAYTWWLKPWELINWGQLQWPGLARRQEQKWRRASISVFSKSLFKFLGPVLSAFDLVEILSFKVSALNNSFIYGCCLTVYTKPVLYFYCSDAYMWILSKFTKYEQKKKSVSRVWILLKGSG